MKKYTVLFLKNRLLITSLFGSFFFLLFFFVSLFIPDAAYPPIFALLAYVPFVIWYGIDIIMTIRFRKLIRFQENLLNVVFNDDNAIPLFPKSLTYISNSWLIFSGKEAFHKLFIERISIKTIHTNMGNDYNLKIMTRKGKTYTKVIDSYTSAKKIQNWLKNTKCSI